MKCLYCPDFVTSNPAESTLGFCRIDATPGTINPLAETKCSKHPAQRKLSDKMFTNQLGVING